MSGGSSTEYPPEPREQTGRSRQVWSTGNSRPQPNRRWVAEITFVHTWQRFCYTALVTDEVHASRTGRCESSIMLCSNQTSNFSKLVRHSTGDH
jgi:hypothetical protein